MRFDVVTLNQRPDFTKQVQQINMAAWPMFMKQAGASDRHWSTLLHDYPEYQLILCEAGEEVLAIGHMIPAMWDGTKNDLPGGWDEVLMQGLKQNAWQPNTISMLGAVVAPHHRGEGLGLLLLRAMHNFAKEMGCDTMIAPVRPSWKSRYPLTPIERYIHWTHHNSSSNMPFDPWIRVHVRLGAEIVKPAPDSMLVSGTVEQWEAWTDMCFPESDYYIVPGALHKIMIDCEQNTGRYAEPHIWVSYQF